MKCHSHSDYRIRLIELIYLANECFFLLLKSEYHSYAGQIDEMKKKGNEYIYAGTTPA